MSLRRMLPFIFVNIIVSLAVVLLVLYWWDSRQVEVVATPEATLVVAEATVAAADAPTLVAAEPETETEEVAEAPAAEEAEGPPVHIVQAGDTLGKISERYGVPLEDIAEANNIVNVNTIAVGQELLIPVGGIPTATPEGAEAGEEAEGEPTRAVPPTPLPTEPPAEGTVIVEISEVIGVGELADEAVRITNAGTRPVALQEWQLLDEDGHVFTFAAVTLYGSSEAGSPAILVHTETGQNGASNLYWGQETAVWEPGETVTLRDAEGTVQATYVIP